jgi:hypothetical protein
MVEQNGERPAVSLGADGDEQIVELAFSRCRILSPRIARRTVNIGLHQVRRIHGGPPRASGNAGNIQKLAAGYVLHVTGMRQIIKRRTAARWQVRRLIAEFVPYVAELS